MIIEITGNQTLRQTNLTRPEQVQRLWPGPKPSGHTISCTKSCKCYNSVVIGRNLWIMPKLTGLFTVSTSIRPCYFGVKTRVPGLLDPGRHIQLLGPLMTLDRCHWGVHMVLEVSLNHMGVFGNGNPPLILQFCNFIVLIGRMLINRIAYFLTNLCDFLSVLTPVFTS